MFADEMTDCQKDTLCLRHIRRHVYAPIHRFVAVVPPELSSLCSKELAEMGISDTDITQAGVEFSGKLAACYMANLWLRTASRILCLLPSFRAGAVEDLFNKVSRFRWELWFNRQIPLLLKAYIQGSRIEHEGMAADVLLKGIERRFHDLGMKAPSVANTIPAGNSEDVLKQRVFVHLRDNRAVISLDTSGLNLHMRGYRPQHTGAPLRETLAAGLLVKSEWEGNSPLVDGMCGSGTISIEAALIARRIPPGMKRSYLFERWPSFMDKTWAFLNLKAGEQSLARSPVPIFAIDSSPQAISVARKNAERAGVDQDVEWLCQDFLEFVPGDHGLRPGLLLLNPPYGKRLTRGDESFSRRLGEHLRRHFGGWRIVVIATERPVLMDMHVKSMRFWNMVHGGIPIVVGVGRL